MKTRVNITLDEQVIKRIDKYASKHFMSRSAAITMLILKATEESKDTDKS